MDTTASDMTLEDPDQRSRKLVEAVRLAEHPIPLDVAAALIDASTEETLALGEHLVGSGLLAASGDSFIPTGADTTGLTSVHVAYLYRELARSFTAAGYADRDPALVGGYLLKAGDADSALPLVDAAVTRASERGSAAEVVELIDAAIAAIEEDGLATDLEARLRVERAKFFQLAGASELAADDLRAALRRLDGAARVDALGFLAAVEDNRQQSQRAEVYAASAIAEAIAIGQPLKAGSVLLLQARILQRIGFPFEADLAQVKGSDALEAGGSPYQRWLAVQNRARIALDRGKAIEAEPLFAQVFDRAADVAGPAAAADAAAWLARAQFLRGHPREGLESARAAIALGEESGTSGPVFLSHMAKAEGAIRFAAHEQGLDAADSMLACVLSRLPDWENAARYLRAKALLGLGRVEDAAEEIEAALALCPKGINGWKWRLRVETFALAIQAAQGGEWPKQWAEDLTDELLQGQWLDIAAELMAVRAGVEGDQELARQSAALALQLGIPTAAAAAIEAGGLWVEASSVAVAARIKETAHHVDPAWREAWMEQSEIAAALAAPEVVDVEVTAAAAALQADLDAAMVAAGLADPAATLSPAQRRAGGLVRRRRGWRTRVWIAAAAAIAAVFVVAIASFVVTRPSLEETRITELPEVFTGQWVTFGRDATRTGAGDGTGVEEPEGFFWRNRDNQGEYFAPPVVIRQKVVVGGLDGQMYFIDRRRGDELTNSTPTGGRIDTAATGVKLGPAGRGGGSTDFLLAIVASGDDRIYAFDISDGTEIWSKPYATCCTPTVDDATGRIYIAGEDGFLHVLDLDGNKRDEWPTDGAALGGPITTAVTLAAGNAYVGVGDELWQFDVGTGVGTACDVLTDGTFVTPVVSEGTVYAANQDQYVHLLDTEGCAEYDRIFVQDDLTVKPAVLDGIVYQPGLRGVSAWDTHEPDPKKRQLWGPAPIREGALLAPTVKSSPAIAGGLIYFGAQDGYVYALDVENGDLVWEWREGVPIRAAVAVTDGVVYVATTDGQVIAIGGKEGVTQPIPTTTAPTTTAPPVDTGPGAG